MGQTTLPCSEATRDRLEELRGDDFKSWDTFLKRIADAWEMAETTDAYQAGEDKPVDKIVTGIQDEIDSLAFQGALTEAEAERILSSLQTIEERTGKIEQILEGLQ